MWSALGEVEEVEVDAVDEPDALPQASATKSAAVSEPID